MDTNGDEIRTNQQLSQNIEDRNNGEVTSYMNLTRENYLNKVHKYVESIEMKGNDFSQYMIARF
jgi:hypothetical protein